MKKRLVASMAVGMLAGLVLSPPADAAVTTLYPTGYVIGANGAMYTSVKRPPASGGSPVWQPPVQVTAGAIASPGTGISAARFPDGNFAAFYVGLDGLLRASVTTTQGQWLPPAPITVAGTYTPGAHVVTVKSPVGADAVAVDHNNWIYVTRTDYRRPVKDSMGVPAPFSVNVPSGAPLSALALANGDLSIAVVDSSGILTMLQLTSAGAWRPTVQLTDAGVAAPGSTVKMVLAGSSPIIFWIDTDGFVHRMVPTGPNGPSDQLLAAIGPLPVTAGLSPVVLPNGQVALFFVGSNGAVDVVMTGSTAGPVFTLTQPRTIPPGMNLEMALNAESTASRYDIDGDLCPPMRPWPWPGPWPPRGAWAGLAVSISPSGSIVSSQLRLIGLTDNVITGGNIAALA